MVSGTQTDDVVSRSPQDQEDVVVRTRAADADAVQAAITRARRAQSEWALEPLARADALNSAAEALARNSDELAELVVREVGKPVGEARQELMRGVRILRYQAQAVLDADGETFPSEVGLLVSRRRPHGVAGLITPWNFPIAIPLWKAAPALATGNAVVLKPSSEAVGCALRLAEVIGSELPEDILQVVPGGAPAATALIAAVDAVSFTGSTGVGREVARAATERGIPAQCELGGQNASIVLPDADLAGAAQTIAAAAMGYAGQKCTATSRVIVVGGSAELGDALIEAVAALPLGDPADPATVIGPLINPAARDEVIAAAEQATLEGGRIALGGAASDQLPAAVEPTVICGQSPGARLGQEEVFGPIVTVLDARTVEDAVAISNAVPFGLVTSVFTRDLDAALSAVEGLDTGMIRINQPTSGVDFHVPFGGEKDSSIGPREQGKAARDFFTSLRTVTIAGV